MKLTELITKEARNMENMKLTKLECIRENKEAAIAAINAYLDRIYGLRDMFFDENLELKSGLEYDEKAVTILKEMIDETSKYEVVREKLTNDDINLSLYEINLVALSFLYVNQIWGKQINNLKKAVEESSKVIATLFKGENVKDNTSILID